MYFVNISKKNSRRLSVEYFKSGSFKVQITWDRKFMKNGELRCCYKVFGVYSYVLYSLNKSIFWSSLVFEGTKVGVDNDGYAVFMIFLLSEFYKNGLIEKKF